MKHLPWPILILLVLLGCDSSETDEPAPTIQIGLNIEQTGALADVGEQSLVAAEMFVDQVGAVEIGGTSYALELVVVDNQGTEDGATVAANRLISTENVLAMVGPNPSNAAIAAGGIANNLETLMISPWSTNPATTLNRPWVFRVPFLDTYQGPVLADFATEHYGATSACVLFASDNDYPSGLAESFRDAWLALHGAGSVPAYETFSTGATSFANQLNAIAGAGCDILFTPQYAHEVPAIVTQAHAADIDIPILGADSWGGTELLTNCGDDCEGYFFSAHYVAAGATGATKTFIDGFEARHGSVPTDVGALTWDAMLLVEEALKSCGEITGDLATDRACIRDAMAGIDDFPGITGTMTFDAQGDPIKCVVMVRIENGTFTAYDSVCPAT